MQGWTGSGRRLDAPSAAGSIMEESLEGRSMTSAQTRPINGDETRQEGGQPGDERLRVQLAALSEELQNLRAAVLRSQQSLEPRLEQMLAASLEPLRDSVEQNLQGKLEPLRAAVDQSLQGRLEPFQARLEEAAARVEALDAALAGQRLEMERLRQDLATAAERLEALETAGEANAPGGSAGRSEPLDESAHTAGIASEPESPAQQFDQLDKAWRRPDVARQEESTAADLSLVQPYELATSNAPFAYVAEAEAIEVDPEFFEWSEEADEAAEPAPESSTPGSAAGLGEAGQPGESAEELPIEPHAPECPAAEAEPEHGAEAPGRTGESHWRQAEEAAAGEPQPKSGPRQGPWHVKL